VIVARSGIVASPRSAVAWATAALLFSPVSLRSQESEKEKPQVEIVKTLGCVEKRAGSPATWWLTRAVEPEVVKGGVFNVTQVEDAKASALGDRDFQLVGVADFLDAEGLLEWGQRSEFTTAEQANATGELRERRTVLVKGLLIEADPVPRINLLAVVGLAEDCD